MRDDGRNWDPVLDPDSTIEGDGVSICMVRPVRQVLVSGVTARPATTLPLVGWPDPATAGAYALVLRRDRVLEVNGPERGDGWDSKAALAVSDMTDGYSVFEIAGRRAADLLKRGAALDAGQPSRSVARLVFGLSALIYRFGDKATYRLHVPAPYGQAAWVSLTRAAEATSDI